MPQLKDLRRNPILTNISKAFRNDQANYIGMSLLPELPVAEDAGFYYVYDKSGMKVVETRITPNVKASVAEVERNLSKVPYGPLEKQALDEFLSDDEIKRSKDPLNARIDTTENVTDVFLLAKEAKAAALLSSTSVLTQNTTLSGTSQWSDFGNSNPFNDIRVAKNSVKANGLRRVNTAWMSFEVWSIIENHPDFLDRIKWSERGIMTPEIFASLIGVKQILIGDAAKNTAVDGQTDVLASVWGKHFGLAYIEARPGLKQLSLGYTLQLEDGRGMETIDSRKEMGEYERISDYYLQYVMTPEVAYSIQNAVA
ncbi:hypothetical protein ACFWP5_08820 [Streptomyces sp. NPDC058469]|uniref:hypothetical protein n=1 Tax=Streptomyces sp. NPDC058469 TaxID=3346514 RepID=UPI00365A0386